MKNTFRGYYQLTDDEFKELWDKCIFVLDTNVLTNLYRYPKDARDDLIKIFKKISDRLWIPHQVALEYQENRLSVISEQARKFYEVKNLLNDTLKNLKNKFEQLSLEKRHSAIKPDDFLDKASRQFEKYQGELETFEKKQPDVFNPDKLRDEIDKLFEGRIGPPPQNQESLNEIYKEGEKRYEINMPPGYMDIEKEKSNKPHLFNQMEFKREYGDLILWYQLIDQAKKENIKYILFITDDDKEDWWWIVDSQGKKTIGPRPELIEEIRSKAEVNIFYMYNTERFLKYAQHHLKAKVKPESISEVRDIQEERIYEEGLKWEAKLERQSTLIKKLEIQKIMESKDKKIMQKLLENYKSDLNSFESTYDDTVEDELKLKRLIKILSSRIVGIEKSIFEIDEKLNSLKIQNKLSTPRLLFRKSKT